MSESLVNQSADGNRLTSVRSEQVRIIYSAIPASLLTILVNSTILSAVQWHLVNHAVIITWFLVTNCLSLFRLSCYQQFRKLDKEKNIIKGWYHLIVITSALSGLTWGAAGVWLFTEFDIGHQVFLAFVIGGMCAGGITSLSAIMGAAWIFVALSIIPVTIRFTLIDTSISNEMAIMCLVFMAMVLLSAKRLNTTIVESISIRYKNELAEQAIFHQMQYDELTDLPNRRQLLKHLKREIDNSIRHNRIGAVLFIDLDHFKRINNSLGHDFGNELLLKIAKRIQSRLRSADTAARLGADEFIVLLPEIGLDLKLASLQATRVAEDIAKLLDSPLVIEEHSIHLTVSIGISLFPDGESDPEKYVQYADVAMDQAKNEGRDIVRLFSQDLQDAVNHRRMTEKGLRQALENEEFELYFQPQFDTSTRIIGAEALLRWNHPDKGVLVPEQFIELAEETGLIVPIGDWVMRTTCEHLARLGYQSNLVFAVNVSPRQFTSLDFIDRVENILLETDVDPKKLKLEITEGMTIDNVEQIIEIMNQLKASGIRFSVDDFGTGYSSLAYLNRLPVDELKIDRSFVREISATGDNAIIVDTIIVMAKHLNLDVIAEGVETSEELNYLRQRKCQIFQGNYFGRPEPYDQFLVLTKKVSQSIDRDDDNTVIGHRLAFGPEG